MTEELPWGEYSKARIPGGWAYPLGRDRIADALREAGAVLGWLDFLGPWLLPESGRAVVLRLQWMGDALPGYHGSIAGGRNRLQMSLYAVPSTRRSQIGRQMMGGPLQAACTWATAALAKGNAWSASEHEFLVIHTDGEVQVGLLHGEVTSDLRCREVPLEGCSPCPSPTPRSSATTS